MKAISTASAREYEILGKELKTCHTEQRTADVRHSLADISLGVKRLGYEIKVDFMKGLTKTTAYFDRNSDV